MIEVRTSNRWERKVADKLKADGWIVFKRGWPDFMAVRGSEIRFIEVKPPTFFRGLKMKFSPSQKLVATVFKKYLGKEVELWNAWNEFDVKTSAEIEPIQK